MMRLQYVPLMIFGNFGDFFVGMGSSSTLPAIVDSRFSGASAEGCGDR